MLIFPSTADSLCHSSKIEAVDVLSLMLDEELGRKIFFTALEHPIAV